MNLSMTLGTLVRIIAWPGADVLFTQTLGAIAPMRGATAVVS
jgi:hypothetical protein